MLIVNPHAIELDIGITNIPNPVGFNVIELYVVAITTDLWNDFKILDKVLYFYISLLIYGFCLWIMLSVLQH